MIYHEHKAIFVHIQKTGGSSVSKALGVCARQPDQHFLARDLKQAYAVYWDEYFKFAFVRNPWARLVSWYAMIDGHRAAFQAGQKVNRFHAEVLSRTLSFAEFLEKLDFEFVDDDGPKWIFRNQLDYLTDEQGNMLVDFVGRTETLADDFERIQSRFAGAPLQMMHINRSRHEPYTTYYTPDLAALVAARYARDLEYFGYRFGD